MKLTSSQKSAIDSAASDRLQLANRIVPLLSLDGVPQEGSDVRDLVAGGSDGRVVEATDSEPGVQLSATIAGRIDTALEGREVRMDFDVLGVLIPGFLGELGHVRHTGATSEIEAYTTAYDWPETPLGEDTEYVNAPADRVAFSALSVLSNRYANIELPPGVSEPRITLQGSERLARSDSISDVIDALEGSDEAQVRRFVDTARNVATAYPLTPLTQATDTVWEVKEGEDCDFGAVEVTPVFEKAYYAVEVQQEDEAGETYVLARVRIDNGLKNVPASRIYVIDYPVSAEPQDEAADRENAYQIAFNEAMRRGKDAVTVSAPVCYWPFWIDRGDVVGVETREFVDTGVRGSITRRYVFRASAFSWGPERSEGTLSGEGLLVSETFTAEEPKVRKEPVAAGELWGYDFAEAVYFSDSLPWATYISEDGCVELDTEVARSYGVEVEEVTEGDMRYVEVSR